MKVSVKEPAITMKSPKAELLGIKPELFEDFFAWDCRPKYIAVIRLQGRFPHEDEAYTGFFEALKYVVSEVRIVAPIQEIIPYLERYGFRKMTEPCGTPYYTNRLFFETNPAQ